MTSTFSRLLVIMLDILIYIYVSLSLLFSFHFVVIVVLQDEETGAWYQHRGRDFKVPLVDHLLIDGNVVGAKRGFNIWPGCRHHHLIQFTSFWFSSVFEIYGSVLIIFTCCKFMHLKRFLRSTLVKYMLC